MQTINTHNLSSGEKTAAVDMNYVLLFFFNVGPSCHSVCAPQAFISNFTEKAREKEQAKERAKEKEKEKKNQQKKKKANDLGNVGQKGKAPAFANKQVVSVFVRQQRGKGQHLVCFPS